MIFITDQDLKELRSLSRESGLVKRCLDEIQHLRIEVRGVESGVEKRQQALEILGAAIAELLPDFRASGDVVEHATAVAAELRKLKEKPWWYSQANAMLRICPGCRSRDGEHKFDETCTFDKDGEPKP